jgi:putative flippase GtrA
MTSTLTAIHARIRTALAADRGNEILGFVLVGLVTIAIGALVYAAFQDAITQKISEFQSGL